MCYECSDILSVQEAAAISSIGGNAGQFAAAAYNNALIYARVRVFLDQAYVVIVSCR